MTLQTDKHNVEAELEVLMNDVNMFFADPDKQSPEDFDEEQFAALLNRGLPVYKSLMDECTQEELDAYNEKFESFYPFFQSIQDHIEKQSN